MRSSSGSFIGLMTLIVALGVGCGGCAPRNIWNPFVTHSWLDPTRTIAENWDDHRQVPIQKQVDDNEQVMDVFPNSEPPALEDLEWSQKDYIISPGDVLDISVLDLFGEGRQAELRRPVSNEGFVSLPFIGQVKAAGYSVAGVIANIEDAYRPDYLQAPVVSVTPAMQLENVFSISGAVARPNRYNITRPEFRLLEALTLSGDVIQSNIEYIYVVRKSEQAEAMDAAAPKAATPTPPAKDTKLTPQTLPPMPAADADAQDDDSDADAATTEPAEADSSATTPDVMQSSPDQTPAADQSESSELLRQLQQYMPVEKAADQESEPAAPEAEPADGDSDAASSAADDVMGTASDSGSTGDSAEQSEQADDSAASDDEPAADDSSGTQIDELKGLMGSPESAPSKRPVKPVEMISFSDVAAAFASSGDVDASAADSEYDPDDVFGWAQEDISDMARIIVIDLTLLKQGEVSQNIIIRDGDTIIVPPLTVGEFYVHGDVNRPGPYSLTGRKVTLKMAIAAASGFSALAWPSNSVLVRRLDDTREIRIPIRLDRIMSGKEPDIMLKPDDQIIVGSNIMASFLAVLRNSFRMTYGAGFIYDRNFAEKDLGQFNNLTDAWEDFTHLAP